MKIDRNASAEAVARCMAYAKSEIMEKGLDLNDMYSVDLYAHCEHVAKLAMLLGNAYQMNLHEMVQLGMGGMLHDIGKCEVAGSHTGMTDGNRLQFVQSHTGIGHRVLKPYAFPPDIMEIVLYHHERLDGSGGPTGINDLGIHVQLISVADVFDLTYSGRASQGTHTMGETLTAMDGMPGLNRVALDILKSLLY